MSKQNKDFKFEPVKTVYFVRHGQSEDNVRPVFQSKESPLSKEGRSQAEHVAKRVSKLDFDTLISSPLPRAKQTAEAIHKLTGKDIEYSDVFVERAKPANTYGKSHEDKEAHKIFWDWAETLYTPGARVGDGENYDDLLKRVDEILEFLEKRKEKSLVVVTHGYLIKFLTARILMGESVTADAMKSFLRATAVENTGITVIQYRGGYREEVCWRLWIYNDHSHL